jgi:hypothetical protein
MGVSEGFRQTGGNVVLSRAALQNRAPPISGQFRRGDASNAPTRYQLNVTASEYSLNPRPRALLAQ